MIYLKEKDVLVEKVVGRAAELSSVAKEAREVVEEAMNSVCLVYGDLFQGLLETMDKLVRIYWRDCKLGSATPPYNYRRIAELSRWEQ